MLFDPLRRETLRPVVPHLPVFLPVYPSCATPPRSRPLETWGAGCDLYSASRVQVLHGKAVLLIKGDGEVVRADARHGREDDVAVPAVSKHRTIPGSGRLAEPQGEAWAVMFARVGVVFGGKGLRGNEPELVLGAAHHCLSTASVIVEGINGSNKVGVRYVEVRLWRRLCVRECHPSLADAVDHADGLPISTCGLSSPVCSEGGLAGRQAPKRRRRSTVLVGGDNAHDLPLSVDTLSTSPAARQAKAIDPSHVVQPSVGVGGPSMRTTPVVRGHTQATR